MRHRLIPAALAAGASLALLAGTAMAAAPTWTVVPSVNPSATTLNDAPMACQGIRAAFSWSHLWVLKRMADGAVCWFADKTGKVHSGEGKLL
jgi:hypothetical protein